MWNSRKRMRRRCLLYSASVSCRPLPSPAHSRVPPAGWSCCLLFFWSLVSAGSWDTSSHKGFRGSFFIVPIPVSTPFPLEAQSDIPFECLRGREGLRGAAPASLSQANKIHRLGHANIRGPFRCKVWCADICVSWHDGRCERRHRLSWRWGWYVWERLGWLCISVWPRATGYHRVDLSLQLRNIGLAGNAGLWWRCTS